MEKKVISLSLDPEDHSEMQFAAKQRGMNLSQFVRWIWSQYGERLMKSEETE